jgi:hypothetical protein
MNAITLAPFYRAMTNNRTGKQWQLSGIQVIGNDTHSRQELETQRH